MGSDVAHEHQAAPRERKRLAVGPDVLGVRIQAALDGFVAAHDRGFQIALHQPEPVAVDADLVLGVHRRDRVLAIHDGRDRRLDSHVVNVGQVSLPDVKTLADEQLDVQAMMAKQDRFR